VKPLGKEDATLTYLLGLKRQAAEQALSLARQRLDQLGEAIAGVERELRAADGSDPYLGLQRAAFAHGYFDASMLRLGALRSELSLAEAERSRAELALKNVLYAEDRLAPPGARRS
jgi:hypothetical protein